MARRQPKAHYFVVKVEAAAKGETKAELTRELRGALVNAFQHLGQRTSVKPIVLMPAPRPAPTNPKEPS